MELFGLGINIEIKDGEIIISKARSFKDKMIEELEHNLKCVEYDMNIGQIDSSLFNRQIERNKSIITNHKDIHLQKGKIDQAIINIFFNLTTIDIEKLSLLTMKSNKFIFFIPTLFERISYTIKTYCKKNINSTIENIYEEYLTTIEKYKETYNEANSSIYHKATNKKKIMALMEGFYIDYSKKSMSVTEEYINSIIDRIYTLSISDEEKFLYIEEIFLEITTIIIKEGANEYIKEFLSETQKELFEKSHTERQERRLNEINKNNKKKINNQTDINNDSNSKEQIKKEIPEKIESFFDKIQSTINTKEKDIKSYCTRVYNKGKGIDFDKMQKDYNISQNLIDQYKKEAVELGIEIYEKSINILGNLIKNTLEESLDEKVIKKETTLEKNYSIEDLDKYNNVSDFLIEVGYTFETKNIENNFNKDRNRWLKSDKALKNEFINNLNKGKIIKFKNRWKMDFHQGGGKRIYINIIDNKKIIYDYAIDHDDHNANLPEFYKS